MDTNESVREAEHILHAAGWKEAPGWNGYTQGSCVGGIAPDGTVYVKNIALIRPGDPRYGPDTPDEHHEAAAWLVEHAKARATLAQLPEEEESQGATLPAGEEETPVSQPGDGGDHVTDQAAPADSDLGVVHVSVETLAPTDLPAELEVLEQSENLEPPEISDPGGSFIDADFTIEDLGGPEEPEQLEGPIEDFAYDENAPAEDTSGAFIFGDNLHQMRTAAIGLVVQSALARLPQNIDYARLSELRNFVMGVQEGRWPDDPAQRDELDTLEATERWRRGIETERDAKVAFLIEATREQIEAFDPEAGWPE